MATLRKAVKKTLIETDTTKRVLEALTDHDPRDIVSYMAKNTPRTLLDIIDRMKPAPELEPEEFAYSPSEPHGREDWSVIKESLETMYETGEYTVEDLIDAAIEMTEGGIDRYTAGLLVKEIFK